MPVGLVRSAKSAGKLRKATGATEEQVVIGDAMDVDSLAKAMAGCDSVILCSSATPKILFSSILKILVKKLLRKTPGRPEFKWPPNGEPEVVDWQGAKNQVDAALAAGVKHFVFLGSMVRFASQVVMAASRLVGRLGGKEGTVVIAFSKNKIKS